MSTPLFPPSNKITPQPQLKRINVSAVRTYNQCKRKFFWEQVRNFSKDGIYIPFLIGSAMHSALEALYQSKIPGNPPRKLEDIQAVAHRYMDDELATKFLDPKDKFDLAKARAMTSGMLACYTLEQQKALATRIPAWTEESMLLTIPELDLDFIGTIDLAFRKEADKDTQIRLADYKNPANFDWIKIELLEMDLQLGVYANAVQRVLGWDVLSFSYECIKKPGIRMKNSETPQQYIERLSNLYKENPQDYVVVTTIKQTKKQLAQVWNDFLLTLQEIKWYYTRRGEEGALDPENWPRNTNACGDYFKRCMYADVCLKGERSDRVAKFTQRKDIDRGVIHRG